MDSSDDSEIFGGLDDEEGEGAHAAEEAERQKANDPAPEYVQSAEFTEFVEKNLINMNQ